MADMAGDDLTAEQTDKLLQFQDLTGIDDTERCKGILSVHNWDIEVAVQARFSEQEGTQSVFRDQRPEQRVSRPSRTPAVNVHPLDQRVYVVSRPRPHSVVGWGYFLILFPFRFIYSTFVDILRFALRLIRPDPRRYVTDPLGDVRAFITDFELSHGSTHPNFYRGTYSQALAEAKRELCFLLVYLHGDDHEDTDAFCRNTICDERVIEFVNTRLMIWACNCNSPEGYRVSQALRENTYPFLALVVLRNGRMTVVARIEGPVGPSELISQLSQVIEDNESSLVAARADREELTFNQSLRAEQDEAYFASLRADQEKERKKREEVEKKDREVQEALDREIEQQRRTEEVTREKEILRRQIPQEPDADCSGVIDIVLKLPNGTRLERRFMRTDSLKCLYNYVFVHESAPDDFVIVSNYPRRTLPCCPSPAIPDPPSFLDFGLGTKEVLFVHDNDA